MKIKKAVQVYTLTVPARQQRYYSFFESPTTQTLYFTTAEDAKLYQEIFFPNSIIDKEVQPAVQDKDKKGNDRWVLIRKTEDMHNSDHNKTLNQHDYYRHSLYYATTQSLSDTIAKNPDSVFVVKESGKTEVEDRCEMGGPSSTTVIYDGSDIVDKDTRFLYVSNHERWFVERGAEITVTPVRDLVVHRATELNQQQTDAERAVEEQEVYQKWGGSYL